MKNLLASNAATSLVTKKTLTITALAAVGMIFSQSVQAAFVVTSFNPAENVVSGVNQGGLNSGSTYTNGDDALKFAIQFVDAGVTFDTILTVTFSAGSVPIINANGTSSARLANGNNGELSFTVGAVTSSAPGTATATFDGFSSLFFRNGGDAIFGGSTISMTTNAETAIFPLAPNGSTLADAPGAGLLDFNSVTSSFTVSAVPEPTSLGLLGMACVGMLARRRRCK